MAYQQLFEAGQRPAADEARARCHDKYNAELIISTSGSKKYFHIPKGDSEEPRCGAILTRNDWRRAPLAIYPAEYNAWCTDCLAYEFPERSNIEVSE